MVRRAGGTPSLGGPCQIAVQLVLEGVLDIRGVHAGDFRADTGSAGGGGAGACRVDATRTGDPFLGFLESKTETDGCRCVVDVCALDVGAFEVGVLYFNGLVCVCQLDVEFWIIRKHRINCPPSHRVYLCSMFPISLHAVLTESSPSLTFGN